MAHGVTGISECNRRRQATELRERRIPKRAPWRVRPQSCHYNAERSWRVINCHHPVAIASQDVKGEFPQRESTR